MDSKNIFEEIALRGVSYESMGRMIEYFSPKLKETINLMNSFTENEKRAYSEFYALLSLMAYFQYISVELASVSRAYLRADLDMEKRYNLKWINCVILEAYKHLYGYGGRRKKTLWVSTIRPLYDTISNCEFKQGVDALERRIIEFGEGDITDRGQRDLGIHYDFEPHSVYKMLMKLSEKEEFQRMKLFMLLLQDISFFVSKHIDEYTISINNVPQVSLKYGLGLFDFDIFEGNKDEIYSTTGDTIASHAQKIGEFIHRELRLPVLIRQILRVTDDRSLTPFNRLIEIQKVVIQLEYLYIDLASAMRALIRAEYSMEKKLLMKQMGVIVFEGYRKIYGLSDEYDESFWKLYVRPVVLESENELLMAELQLKEGLLQLFRMKVKKQDEQRQLSVHFDEGILKVYSMLQSLTQIEEFLKVADLLKLLPEITGFLGKCAHAVELKSQNDEAKKRAITYEEIMSLLEKVPDSSQKDRAIEWLKKYQSGELLEELKRRARIQSRSRIHSFAQNKRWRYI